MQQKSLIAFFLAAICSLPLYAEPTNQHVVIAPACLAAKLTAPYESLARNNHLTLLAVDEHALPDLIAARHAQKKPCGGFHDVTAAWYAAKQTPTHFLAQQTKSIQTIMSRQHDYAIHQRALVNALLPQINPAHMWADLGELSSFQTRSAVSDNGVKAAQWLRERITAIAVDAGRRDISVYEVKNSQWLYKQPSIVMKWGHSDKPGIVLGAHMDTLPALYGKMPGADDDGSGSVTLLEVARVLMNSGVEFDSPIYFIWYSAEEMGLIGSQAVVADFAAKKIPVAGVIQFDMTGYTPHNKQEMWILNDYVNPALTTFMHDLITEYVKRPVFYTACGYDCSDHASWHALGYPAVAPAESAFEEDNKDIHTAQDTMDKLSLEHMTDYAKLGVAFAVELAKE